MKYAAQGGKKETRCWFPGEVFPGEVPQKLGLGNLLELLGSAVHGDGSAVILLFRHVWRMCGLEITTKKKKTGGNDNEYLGRAFMV